MSIQYNPLMEYKSPRNDKKNIEMLFEYYDVISHPKDVDMLGNWQVWIYGSDREKYPPHCHVRLSDGSLEFEVSLLDWSVINIKHSNMPNSWDSIGNDIKKGFFTWLNRQSIPHPRDTNKYYMYTFWDGANYNNKLENWVDKKSDLDLDLIDYLNPHSIPSNEEVMAAVQKALYPIYISSDVDYKKYLHNLPPLQLIKELKLDLNIREGNKKLINIIQTAEKMMYGWTFK